MVDLQRRLCGTIRLIGIFLDGSLTPKCTQLWLKIQDASFKNRTRRKHLLSQQETYPTRLCVCFTGTRFDCMQSKRSGDRQWNIRTWHHWCNSRTTQYGTTNNVVCNDEEHSRPYSIRRTLYISSILCWRQKLRSFVVKHFGHALLPKSPVPRIRPNQRQPII